MDIWRPACGGTIILNQVLINCKTYEGTTISPSGVWHVVELISKMKIFIIRSETMILRGENYMTIWRPASDGMLNDNFLFCYK